MTAIGRSGTGVCGPAVMKNARRSHRRDRFESIQALLSSNWRSSSVLASIDSRYSVGWSGTCPPRRHTSPNMCLCRSLMNFFAQRIAPAAAERPLLRAGEVFSLLGFVQFAAVGNVRGDEIAHFLRLSAASRCPAPRKCRSRLVPQPARIRLADELLQPALWSPSRLPPGPPAASSATTGARRAAEHYARPVPRPMVSSGLFGTSA